MSTIPAINTFTFPITNQSVRITDQNGDPWFIAKDVCDILGFANPSDATKYLDEDEKALINNPSLTANPNGNVTIFNESGLYSLILKSRKEEAKRFKKWVTSEVLPSIRKRGSYSLPGYPKFAVPQTMIEAMELALATMKENEKLKTEQSIMLPKARVYDAVVANKLMKLHIFARSLPKCNTMQIKRDLMDLGYLHRARGTYKVYSKYRDKLFVEKVDGATGKIDIYVTDEGKKKIVEHYKNGDITRKV